jgi:hypothetical protein
MRAIAIAISELHSYICWRIPLNNLTRRVRKSLASLYMIWRQRENRHSFAVTIAANEEMMSRLRILPIQHNSNSSR